MDSLQMLDFCKKRRETAQATGQQRKIEALLYGQPTSKGVFRRI
jgi:hypothetical protein